MSPCAYPYHKACEEVVLLVGTTLPYKHYRCDAQVYWKTDLEKLATLRSNKCL